MGYTADLQNLSYNKATSVHQAKERGVSIRAAVLTPHTGGGVG